MRIIDGDPAILYVAEDERYKMRLIRKVESKPEVLHLYKIEIEIGYLESTIYVIARNETDACSQAECATKGCENFIERNDFDIKTKAVQVPLAIRGWGGNIF